MKNPGKTAEIFGSLRNRPIQDTAKPCRRFWMTYINRNMKKMELVENGLYRVSKNGRSWAFCGQRKERSLPRRGKMFHKLKFRPR